MNVGAALDELVEERLEQRITPVRADLEAMEAELVRLEEELEGRTSGIASLVSPHLASELLDAGAVPDSQSLTTAIAALRSGVPTAMTAVPAEYLSAWIRVEQRLADDSAYRQMNLEWERTKLLREQRAAAIRNARENIHALRCEIAREELGRLRSFGDPEYAGRVAIARSERTCLEAVTPFLPSGWLADSMAFTGPSERSLTVIVQPKEGLGKSLYSVEQNIVHVLYPRKHPWVALVRCAHELVHQIEEARPQLKIAEWTFYQRRTRSDGFDGQQEELQSLRLLDPRGEYYDHELTRPDHFPHPYLGKQYGEEADSSFELLSFGIEDLIAANLATLRDDVDLRHFVYGALASL